MLNNVLFREKIISLTRRFFTSHHYTEITSPVFVDHPPYESTLTAFKVKNFYLATSPEIYLKKLISQGLKDCFSIAHSFRNLEANSPYHLPEFLMLEWYQMSHTYLDVIKTTISYLRFIFRQLHLQFPPVSYLELDIDPTLPESDFNQKFLNEIEPNLPKDHLVFVTGYSQQLSYFCTPSDNPKIANRFEAYLFGIEIANGNTEDESSPFPLPPCAGCGLGLDRITKILYNLL